MAPSAPNTIYVWFMKISQKQYKKKVIWLLAWLLIFFVFDSDSDSWDQVVTLTLNLRKILRVSIPDSHAKFNSYENFYFIWKFKMVKLISKWWKLGTKTKPNGEKTQLSGPFWNQLPLCALLHFSDNHIFVYLYSNLFRLIKKIGVIRPKHQEWS